MQSKYNNKKEKRNVRSYKVVDTVYIKAGKKASKENTNVANKIEKFLHDYTKDFHE